MIKSVTEIFTFVEQEVEQVAVDWNNFAMKVGAELSETYQVELQQLAADLADAKSVLCDELAHPTLILATTGTTSSGKSTLVNLLCGAEILPVAVQEMSAGVVTVEYGEVPGLVVHETPGAIWECGSLQNLKDKDIYDRLDKLMKAYLESKEEGQLNINCPRSTIYYPFRLIKEIGLLNLPSGTTVKIMDLPGLAHVGDEANAVVIRESKKALCLVTYDSAGTDKERTTNLLNEIVDQVKTLGGSPARMLFILNRIDFFRSDKNWPDSEEQFTEKTRRDIKTKLTDSMEEYKDEIKDLEIVKLSALPAFLSLQMNSDREYAKRLFDAFGTLISEDILDDLKANVYKWSEHDCQRVAEAVWKTSYADQFHDHLSSHIQSNFPQLIIPQTVSKFKDSVGNRLREWATQITRAFINSSEDEYQQESQKIEQVKIDLSKFIKDRTAELREPFEQIDFTLSDDISSDPLVQVEQIIKRFQSSEDEREGYYKTIAKSLTPIYDWRRAVSEGVEKTIKPVISSLQNNKVLLNSPTFSASNKIYVDLLAGHLQDLINLDYKTKAGTKIEARTEVEKEELKLLNRKLNELANVLKLIIDDVAKQLLSREMARVQDAVEHLFKSHLNVLKTGTQKVAPNFGINFSESEIVKIDFIGRANFTFSAGFPVTMGTWNKSKLVKTGSKRIWWTLWIKEEGVYETKLEELESENATIPSIDDLDTAWQLQRSQGELEVSKQVIPWFLKQISRFNENVDRFQRDTMNRYQHRLDQAYQESKLDYDKKMEIWQPLQMEAQELEAKLDRLGKF